jgi:hypothetical protein
MLPFAWRRVIYQQCQRQKDEYEQIAGENHGLYL